MGDVNYNDRSEPGVKVIEWALTDADDGAPINIGAFEKKWFAAWGAAWGGATVTLQGSWDNSYPPRADSWLTLKDDAAAAITLAANASGVINENPIWIRPVSAGGTGTSVRFVVAAR